jgi:type VI secretion system protein ImpK
MSTLTLRRRLPASANPPRFDDHAVGGGIRELLRETALLVTSLGAGGTVPEPEKFRESCNRMISTFSDALTRQGYPADIRQEAMIAQCGLLDETALRHLPAESRASWEHTPLQVEWFKLHDAGEQVIKRIEARLREPSANVDLLECYLTILGIGFRGRHARDGEPERAALISALGARLAKVRPATTQPFVADQPGHRLSGWFYRLSPWVVAGLACIVAAIVWGLGSVAVNARLEHVAPAKVSQP